MVELHRGMGACIVRGMRATEKPATLTDNFRVYKAVPGQAFALAPALVQWRIAVSEWLCVLIT